MTFDQKYTCMVTDQASPREIAEWLADPLFAAYVRKRQK